MSSAGKAHKSGTSVRASFLVSGTSHRLRAVMGCPVSPRCPKRWGINWWLVGGGNLPLWKIWLRQLGWWHSQYMWKYKMFQTTNQMGLYWLWGANKQQKGGDKAKRCLFVQSLLNHLCQCLTMGGNEWKIKKQKKKVSLRQVYHLVAIWGN